MNNEVLNETEPQSEISGREIQVESMDKPKSMSETMDEPKSMSETTNGEEEMSVRPGRLVEDVRPIGNISSDVRPINVEKLSSGFIVRVGCQTVAVETTKKLTTMIGKYYENPYEFEKQWYSKDVVNRLENIQ